MGNIEILIHNLAMAAWDAGCESGVVWCPDADMSKRGVVPMTQEEGLRNSREHFATHGGGSEASEFDSALRSLRAALDATRADRDRLASELAQVRGELARTKRNHLRRMAQSALHREMWCKRRIVVHWDVMHRGGTRLASLQTAIRAALAAMEGGAK